MTIANANSNRQSTTLREQLTSNLGHKQMLITIHSAAPVRSSQMAPSQTAAMIARERKLATPNHSNRTRLDGGLASYTVVPMSNITAQGQLARVGAGGEDAFRKLKARQMGKSGGGSGRR